MPRLRYLDICRHRLRGIQAPFLCVVQYEIEGSRTRIVAPLAPSRGDKSVLLPEVSVGGTAMQIAMPLLVSVSVNALAEVVASAEDIQDLIHRAVDVLFRGDVVWAPSPH